jgi:MraZ protein
VIIFRLFHGGFWGVLVEIGVTWKIMAKREIVRTVPVPKGVMAYLGQHLRGVDHGRIILPAEWRPKGAPAQFMILVWPVTAPEYLLVLPPSRWEVMRRNLEELSLADQQAALVERLIGSSTCMRALDNYGRLPLPEEASRKLGIESEAILVGRMNKFEVWSPARFAATLANPDTRQIAEAIRSIKI